MKKIFLILGFLIFSLTSYAQQRVSVYIHTVGKVYNANDLTSKDGVIYKALVQTNDTPPSSNWEATGGSGTSSPLTTKGDIYVYGTDNDRLPIGINGQALTVNTSAPLGVEWGVIAGTGDVIKVGTPINNEVGIWTGDGTIEGDADLTFDGSNLTVSGNILGGNLNIVNWDLAYGWGDHSTQGYLTTYNETDPVYLASQASNIDAGDITNLGNLSGTNTGDQNLNDHFAITSNYSTLLSDKDRKGLITSSVTVTLKSIGAGQAEFQMYFLNRSGSTVTFNLDTSPQQYTDQYGTGNIPILPNGYYAYIELVADNVWSVIIGEQAGGTGAVDSVNSYVGTVILDADDLSDTSTSNKFVTASDITTLSNTSGTNTGDQDLTEYLKKDMNTLSKSSYTTTLADKGAYISITSGDITLDKTGLPDGFNQTFYNASAGAIKFVGDATSGVNNDIPSGYFGIAILDGTTWVVSTPSSGGGTGAVESVNTKTGVVVLDTDDIADTSTNRYVSDSKILTYDNWVAEESNVAKLDASNTFIGSLNTFSSIRADFLYLGDNASSQLGYLQIESGTGEVMQMIWESANNQFEFKNNKIGYNIDISSIDLANSKSLVTKEWTLDKISASGGGNVSSTGLPLNDQLAIWTDGSTIEGSSNLRFDGSTLKTSGLVATGNILTTNEMRFSSSNEIPQGEVYYDATLNGIKIQANSTLQFGSPTIQTDSGIVNDIHLYTVGTQGLNIDSAGRVFGTGNSDLAITSTSDDSILITKSYGDANYNGDFLADGSVSMTGDLNMGNRAVQNIISLGTNNTSFSLRVNGMDRVVVGETTFKPNSNNTIDIGTSALSFKDGYFLNKVYSKTFNSEISTTPPATSTSTGTKGDVIYTSDYIYICIATNSWKRVAISTW